MARFLKLGGREWCLTRPKKHTKDMGDADGIAILMDRVNRGRIQILHYNSLKGSEGCPSVDKRELYLIIHECCHAMDWEDTEEEVERRSWDLTNVLWEMGYRAR